MISASEFRRRLAPRWAPPGDISTSVWADRHMRLSPETSAKPGKWVTRSYQRQPLDATSDPAVRVVVLCAAVQMLKTSVMKAAIARTIAVDPKPIMMLVPRKEDAREFADDHMVPMIRDMEALAGKIKLTRMGKTPRNFRGGRLVITSAGAAMNVGGKAIGLLCMDEVDKYVGDVDEEGNPIELALQRQTTFRSRAKAILACSPTLAGSAIDAWFQRSDQRDFYVPCPLCGAWQTMWGKFWSHVRWNDKLETREEQALSARYHCQSCDQPWDDEQRKAAVERGDYRAAKPFNGIAGFRVSQLCSVDRDLSEIVLAYLRAKETPADLKAWVNTTLAEVWEDQSAAPEWERLLDARESYPIGVVPRGGLVLVGGADVHPDRIEVELVAYGRRRESWSVLYEIIEGNTAEITGQPGRPSPWERLQVLIDSLYPHGGGGQLTVSRFFIDSGNQTNTVYQWVRMQPDHRVVAVKGVPRGHLPVSQPKPVDVTVFGRVIKSGLRIRDVVVDFFKSEIYADLRKKKPTQEQLEQGWTYPPGYCHFPDGKNYGDEHFKQLCAEQLVTTKDRRGRLRREWQQMRARNEALDVRVYARAAAWEYGIDRFQERRWQAIEEGLGPQQEGFDLAAPAGDLPRQVVPPERPTQRPAERPRAVPAAVIQRHTPSNWMRGFLR